MSIQEIKNHWETIAQEIEHKGKLTNQMGNTLNDEYLRSMEINAISKNLFDGMSMLDIGCGNGFSTIQYAKKFNSDITGIDYSESMIKNANIMLKDNKSQISGKVSFAVGDVMDTNFTDQKFDIVSTERCLINLQTWENQKIALANIADKVVAGGYFLMLEAFKDNLDTINNVRNDFNLDPINIVWHNRFFIREEFEEFIKKYYDIMCIDNFGSTYMLISRAYSPAVQKIYKVDFNEMGRLASLLPNIGNYNYQQLYILRKKHIG